MGFVRVDLGDELRELRGRREKQGSRERAQRRSCACRSSQHTKQSIFSRASLAEKTAEQHPLPIQPSPSPSAAKAGDGLARIPPPSVPGTYTPPPHSPSCLPDLLDQLGQSCSQPSAPPSLQPRCRTERTDVVRVELVHTHEDTTSREADEPLGDVSEEIGRASCRERVS